MNKYISDRFYLRGKTFFGLFNTILASLFNRVVVRHGDESGKIIKLSIRRGTDFPRKKK